MSATIIPFELPKNEAVMSVHSLIPETAMTAQMLGTERESHAVQISADGLMLTVGYSIMEASETWITNRKGQTSEGIVLAHDYDSGLALLRPATSLGSNYLETAEASTVSVGDRISIIHQRKHQSHGCGDICQRAICRALGVSA